jgi:deoxyhypusine synthase
MAIDRKATETMYKGLAPKTKARLKRAVEAIVKTKEKGGKVVAVVGSGPNIHEGVTTLVAELIRKGIIDGVSTSSAVINHEMAGTLEKVKRIDGAALGFEAEKLPSDRQFEVSILSKTRLEEYQQ